MLESYYDLDLSLSEISENVGMSRQGVRDTIKRAEQQLSEYEEKLGLIYKTNHLQELYESAQKTGDYSELGRYINDL